MRPRYLLLCGGGLLCALFVGCALSSSWVLCLAGACILAAVVCLLLKKQRCLTVSAAAACGFLLLLSYNLAVRLPAENLAGQTLQVTAVTGAVTDTDYGYSCVLNVKKIYNSNGEELSAPPLFRISVYGYDEPLEPYAEVELTVKTRLPSEDGLFSYRRAYHAFLNGTVQEVTASGESGGIMGILYSARRQLEEFLSTRLSDTAYPLLRAMLLGDREGLSNKTTAMFRLTGTGHMLAVSGMHLSLLTGLIALLCRFVPLKRKGSLVVMSACAVGFLLLTGAQFSIQRAVLMLLFGTVAELCSRPRDSKEALGVAVILLCLGQPYVAQHPAFLCSVLATFGILEFAPPLHEWTVRQFGHGHPWLLRAADWICVSLSAWAATLPVSALAFGSVSLLGPICSVLFLPIMTLVMTFGVLTACFVFLPQDIIGIACGKLCSWLSEFLLWGLSLFSDAAVVFYPTTTLTYALLLCCALWCLLTRILPKGKRNAAAILGCVLVVCSGCFGQWLSTRNTTTVTVLSLSYEKCVAVQTNSTLVLVVAGDSATLGETAADYLTERGLSPDLICISSSESEAAEILSETGAPVCNENKLGAVAGDVTAEVRESGFFLTTAQGTIYLGESTDAPASDCSVFLHAVNVAVNEEVVPCDVVCGSHASQTSYGDTLTLTLR